MMHFQWLLARIVTNDSRPLLCTTRVSRLFPFWSLSFSLWLAFPSAFYVYPLYILLVVVVLVVCQQERKDRKRSETKRACNLLQWKMESSACGIITRKAEPHPRPPTMRFLLFTFFFSFLNDSVSLSLSLPPPPSHSPSRATVKANAASPKSVGETKDETTNRYDEKGTQ